MIGTFEQKRLEALEREYASVLSYLMPPYYLNIDPFYFAYLSKIGAKAMREMNELQSGRQQNEQQCTPVKQEFVACMPAETTDGNGQSRETGGNEPVLSDQLNFAVPDLEDMALGMKPEEHGKTIHKNSYLSYTFNKIIKYIRCSSQTGALVKQMLLEAGLEDRKQISAFYKYAFEATKKILNAVSIQKIRDFWCQPQGTVSSERKLFHKMFRLLSWRYLSKIFPSIIYQEERLTEQDRNMYLRMRSCLLTNLQSPSQFTSYIHF